ncbi:MAG TPA: hypothetical protein VLG50_03575 [Candidatus Saccharimonadales bacterium]|nr:hypothetical protein [Candidatus Saccharimonadales bacterium]
MIVIKNISIKTMFLIAALTSYVQASQQTEREVEQERREELEVLKEIIWTSVTCDEVRLSSLTSEILCDLREWLMARRLTPPDGLRELIQINNNITRAYLDRRNELIALLQRDTRARTEAQVASSRLPMQPVISSHTITQNSGELPVSSGAAITRFGHVSDRTLLNTEVGTRYSRAIAFGISQNATRAQNQHTAADTFAGW